MIHGKVKTLYDTNDAQTVLIKYEDKVTAFDGKMVDYPESKGATCCLISALLFDEKRFAHTFDTKITNTFHNWKQLIKCTPQTECKLHQNLLMYIIYTDVWSNVK